MAKSSSNGLKTRWEKEKLLVTSNFSFSHSVFKRLVMQTRKNQSLFGKGLRSTISTNKSCLSLSIVGELLWKNVNKLPEQFAALYLEQLRSSSKFPVQYSPPNSGLGFVQSRSRD